MSPSYRNIRLFNHFAFWDMFWPSYPFFIIWFAELVGSYTLAMSVLAIQNFTAVAMEVPSGVMSDKLERRTVAILGAICALVSAALYAYAPGYAMLAAGAFFLGLYQALMSGNNDAMVYDSLKENGLEADYHAVIARRDGFTSLSKGLAASTGAAIVWLWGFRETFYINVFSSVILVFIAWILVEPKVHSETSEENALAHVWTAFKQVWRNRRLRYIALARGIDGGLGYAAYDFINVFFARFVPVWMLGVLRTASAFMGAAGAFVSHRVTLALGYTRTIMVFIGLNYVVNLASVLANCAASPFIKSLDSLMFDIANPAQNALMQEEFSDKQRATMGSIASLLQSVFYGIFALMVGAVADLVSDYFALVLVYAGLFLILPLYYKGLKAKGKNP